MIDIPVFVESKKEGSAKPKNKRAPTKLFSRVAAFKRFYENRIYTVTQIAEFTGTSDCVAWAYLNRAGAKKKTIYEAIDFFIENGFSFDGALKATGETVFTYTASLENARRRAWDSIQNNLKNS
jgi:hypothetical protein